MTDIRTNVFCFLDEANADVGWPDAFDPDVHGLSRAIVQAAKNHNDVRRFGTDPDALMPYVREWQRLRRGNMRRHPEAMQNSILIFSCKVELGLAQVDPSTPVPSYRRR